MKRILKKVVETIFGRNHRSSEVPDQPAGPVIVQRAEHTVSRTQIDPDAMKVLNRLVRFNHAAYLVGGGVRDLLLGRPVKDFDIATSAHPHEIKRLFRNCRLIGKRFRLAHILFRGKVIEVSTFRRQAGFSDEAELLIKSDNTFGTPEEDARRRDFSVNGLFYSITDLSVIDYVGGLEDLGRKLIRTIGDPNIRFREDPIRILRGIRLAARLGFSFEEQTRLAMLAHREEIWKSAAPRIVEELARMLQQGAAAASIPMMRSLGVLEMLLPRFAAAYETPAVREEVQKDLAGLDAHAKPKEVFSLGLAVAVLYAPLFAAEVAAQGEAADRLKTAADLLDADLERLKFPRVQLEKARLLLAVQHRLTHLGSKRFRPAQLVTKGWFPEALLLLEITQGDTPEGISLLRRWRSLEQRLRRAPAAGRGAEEGGEETAAEALAEGAVPGEAEVPEAPAGETAPAGGAARKKRRGRRGGRGRGRRRPAESAAQSAAAAEGAADLDRSPLREADLREELRDGEPDADLDAVPADDPGRQGD